MDIMRTSNTDIALPCTGDDKANKYVCYKSSGATSCKKINFNKPLALMMTNYNRDFKNSEVRKEYNRIQKFFKRNIS